MTRWFDTQHSANSGCKAGPGMSGRSLGLLALLIGLVLGASASAQEIGGTNDTWGADDTSYDFDAVSLRASLWLDLADGDTYRKGDLQTVGLETNQDAYAVVYRIDTEGLVTILWPRSRMDDGFIFGGHEYQLPVSGSRQLRVSTAEGEGFVEAIISAYPFDLRDLEIDFHHEQTATSWDFQVAGDPFLAINEVNYAVTGLEEAVDFVVTDNVNYYVHREVDHPRYLCNQCHVDDDVAYDPYRDQCTLDISVDYAAYNDWYDRYGYSPVYYNPVYVYVDPWAGNPWVNFWYDPWYRCPPYWGWNYTRTVYVWCDSPYWGGGCWDHYNGGSRRYRPLGAQTADDGVRRKTQEYTRVTGLVRQDKPAGASGARTKTDPRLAGREVRRTEGDIRGGLGGGQDRRDNERQYFPSGIRATSTPGIRLRDNATGGDTARTGTRHTAAGSGRKPTLTRSGGGSDNYRLGRSGARVDSRRATGSDTKPGVRDGGRSIKPVEPRKKGTRIWSSSQGRNNNQNATDRSNLRSPKGSGSQRSSRGREAVKPRTASPRKTTGEVRRSGSQRKWSGSRSSGNSSGSSVRPRKSGSSGSSGSSGRSSGSKSGGSSVRPKSSGSSSGSSGSRSGGGSRGSSGGSRSGGSRGSSGGKRGR